MTRKEFAEIVTFLAACYPSANITEITLNIYYEKLKDIDSDVMKTVVSVIVEKSKFYPSIAEIREEYLRLKAPELNENAVYKAVKIIKTALRDYGRQYCLEALEYIKSQDELLYIIVKDIGFINICNSDMKMYSAEIERVYKRALTDTKEKNLLTNNTKKLVTQIRDKLQSSALMLEVEENFEG